MYSSIRDVPTRRVPDPIPILTVTACTSPMIFFVGYLDPALCPLPQADLQQDILVRILEWMAAFVQPLPRLWHFPEAAHAVAFVNGDGDSMALEDLMNTIATADRFQVPYTTYLMMQDHPKVEPAYESALRQQGHDFGQHAFAGGRLHWRKCVAACGRKWTPSARGTATSP